MRVLILADSLFAARERTLLSRLELGLADEGFVVLQAVPESVKSGLGASLQEVYARGITYNPHTFPLFKGLAVRTIVKALAEADQLDQPQDIDIVHVFGGSAWQLGRDLARELDAGLALEVWRYGLAARTSELTLDPSDRVIYVAPDPLTQQQLTKRQPQQRVHLAEWGVIASMQPGFDARWGGVDGMYARRLGPDRAAGLNPFALLASAGVPLAFGSDSPVTGMTPWSWVRAASTHHTPGSAVSARAAFAAATRGAWRAAGIRDGITGTPSSVLSFCVSTLMPRRCARSAMFSATTQGKP
jgi:hypothetical protein